ncbi:MAG: helicase-associated domain-containing protein, partial [Spirochaetes bacterium]|nr:helicase-associated domain-containing protein [Spirochaetota bacterium]
MTRAVLPFVLAGKHERVEPYLGSLRSEIAKKAARFWIGKEANALRKDECIERLTHALRDGKRVAEVLAELRPDERAVLAVVRRFGGSISGVLLQHELLTRGIVKESRREGYHRMEADPVEWLRERLLLVTAPGYYSSYYSGWSQREYPDVALPAQVAAIIEPAASLEWKASKPPQKAPDASSGRAPAQMMVDLEQMIRALTELDGWKVNKGGTLPVAGRNRLGKLLPVSAGDPLSPPDRVALEYALLCGIGVVEFDGADGWLEPDRAERLLHLPHEAQASEWIRAWLAMRLWQDGIGQVPDRDGRDESLRIDPGALRKARALLAWALTRVAHSPGDWLDLETFLLDLYDITGEGGLSFYWQGYTWRPSLAGVVGKDKLPAGRQRSRAFWLDDEGAWAANALLSTLVHLGVVERGRSGQAHSERWCFRLTECGRAVFGAPEIESRKPSGDEKCLTIQPNHEILLYLDVADSPAVTTLGRIASRETTAGIVQTFKLTRESVYGALEEGMTPAAIESFLIARSRSGLPENVSRSLAEWSRKREALVVRSGVAVGANLTAGHDDLHGRVVGARFVV